MDDLRPTTPGNRFQGFAVSHFLLSLTGFPPFFFLGLLFLESAAATVLVTAALMGAYFPLGMLAAHEGRWTPPAGDRDRVLAVLRPALVAWAWAAVVIYSLLGGVEILFLPAFFISAIFALPSSGFVMIWLAFLPFDGVAGLVAAAFFAGLLPPLLFALGSFWESGRLERSRPDRLPPALPQPSPPPEL